MIDTRLRGQIEALVIATGVASVAAQLVFIRELLVQFQGNEIVVALVMFQWLILGALGARLAAFYKTRTRGALAAFSLFMPVLSLAQLGAIRFGRKLLAPAGVSVGFYAVFCFSLATLLFYALAVGFLLPYSLFVLRSSGVSRTDIRVYLADNLGDICGGALFSFWLVFWATPVQALVLAHLPLAVLAAVLLGRWKLFTVGLVLAISLTAILVEPLSVIPPAGKLEQVTESPYGRVSIVSDRGQMTMVVDGRPMTATPDPVRAEENVHFALSQLHQVRRVLVISAVAGMMTEISKYTPEKVDLVELDPVVAAWQFKYGFLKKFNWLETINDDGRNWLRNCSATYDAVLVNLGEPDTFQANRFFTLQFFQTVASRLSTGGVLSFSVAIGGNYFSAVEKKIVACLYATAGKVFPHVMIFPGEKLNFVCSRQPVSLNVPRLLEVKSIKTDWVGPFFEGNVDLRAKELDRWLGRATSLNTDQRPVVMGLVLQRWYAKYGGFPWGFYLVLSALLATLVFRMNPAEKVIATTGFVSMGAEIWIILAFQILQGNLYLKIGVIVTMFLAGLLPGAYAAIYCKKQRPWLLASDLLMAFGLTAMALAVEFAGARLPEIFFYLSGFLLSLLAGFQFPLAFQLAGRTNTGAATLFAIDVLGAASGCLVTSLILIIYLGLPVAAAVLVALKLASSLMMGFSHGLPNTKNFSAD